MRKIKYFLEQSWLLMVAAFFFGLLLAVTNAVLGPKIKENQTSAMNEMMQSLLTEAKTFDKALSQIEIAGNKTDVYMGMDNTGNPVGFAFVGTGAGFADKVQLVIAVDEKCSRFLGFDVLFSNETPGFGSRITEDWFIAQFIGAPTAKLKLAKTGDTEAIDDEIVAITGATITSEAVVKIFNTHIEQIKSQLTDKGLLK